MARNAKKDEPIELTTLAGVRRLLVKLLQGRVDRDGLRRYAQELQWPWSTLHKRINQPETLTIDEVNELLAKFRVKLYVNLV